MARRRRIPSLRPDGLGCRPEHTYAERTGPGGGGKTPEAERRKAEPWRATGYGAEYRRNRQAAIDRTMGRCAICGARIARKVGKTWKMDGGEVHHVRSLSEGGGSDVANLLPLCVKCHRRVDRERRDAHGPQ